MTAFIAMFETGKLYRFSLALGPFNVGELALCLNVKRPGYFNFVTRNGVITIANYHSYYLDEVNYACSR
jgi:hypothetical protein